MLCLWLQELGIRGWGQRFMLGILLNKWMLQREGLDPHPTPFLNPTHDVSTQSNLAPKTPKWEHRLILFVIITQTILFLHGM